MRLAFFGTPRISAIILLSLIESEYDVVSVVTAEDKPKGRGLKAEPAEVKKVASVYSIPTLTPKSLRDESFIKSFLSISFDLAIVCAYGKIIPKRLLEVPYFGFVNVHFSLLPKYRGASCVQYTILFGEEKTGVTFFLIDEGLDSGLVLEQVEAPILSDDTSCTLTMRLTELAKLNLAHVIDGHVSGHISPRIQEESEITYCPLIQKSDGRLYFNLEPEVLVNVVRAMYPWPKAYCCINSKRVIIHKAHAEKPLAFSSEGLTYGQVAKTRAGFGICAKGGLFVPDLLQLEGRKVLNNKEFLSGYKDLLQKAFL